MSNYIKGLGKDIGIVGSLLVMMLLITGGRPNPAALGSTAILGVLAIVVKTVITSK